MKKHLFVTLTLLLSSTVLGDLAMAEKDEPPEPPPIFSTRVVNDETEPVPVTGIVTVGNFPAALSVEGTVDIGNLPAVQDVEVINSIDNPIVATCTDLKEPIQAEVSADDLWDVTLYRVPDDRLLEIRYISIRQFHLSENEYLIAELGISLNGERKDHTLQAFSGPVNLQVGDDKVWLLAQSLSLYADPGSQVRLTVFGATQYAGGKATLAGTLEPLAP
jgi:hypothetical protein